MDDRHAEMGRWILHLHFFFYLVLFNQVGSAEMQWLFFQRVADQESNLSNIKLKQLKTNNPDYQKTNEKHTGWKPER